MGNDSYISSLEEAITSMESGYYLEESTEEGQKVSSLDIVDVINFVSNKLENLDQSTREKLNKEVGKYAMAISYINLRLRFYGKIKLDYSKYPFMDEIAKILIEFTYYANITDESVNNLNKIIAVLSSLDDKLANMRFELSYRFLRMAILLVLFGNYVNCCIVSDFILDQFIVKGG